MCQFLCKPLWPTHPSLRFYCWFILYTWHLLLLCCSSWWFLPFFSLLKVLFGEFFLIRIVGLRTEDVICCTDCKAPWGKLCFVILSYINKFDLTWLLCVDPLRLRRSIIPVQDITHSEKSETKDFFHVWYFVFKHVQLLSSYSVCSFDLMKLCWEEKPQSRPSFSSLVVSLGNMLTDDYKKV